MNSHRMVKCEPVKLDLRGWPQAQLVRLSDEERGIRVVIHPAAGGEISSFEVRFGGSWHEILYGALDYQSTASGGWGRAPVLWPSVGRSLTDSQIAEWKRTGHPPTSSQCRFGESLYEIGDHGFARGMRWDWDLNNLLASCSTTCSTKSSPATLKKYPFNFKLSVTYTLARGRLLLRYEVIAGPNHSPMPFAIGNHIFFRMPFTDEGRFDTCSIRTGAREILCQDALCLLSGETISVDLSTPVPLAERRFCDLVLGGYRRDAAWLELNDPTSISLRMSHAEVPQGMTYLSSEADISFVFWGDPALGFFCPEPWLGKPNGLNTGLGCIFLPPKERFVWEIQIAPVLHSNDKPRQERT